MNEIDAAKIQAAALEKIAKAIADFARVVHENNLYKRFNEESEKKNG